MKSGVAAFAVLFSASSAYAGGLFLPGSGAVSTSRAGAAVASVDSGEALGINPAGLAKTKGTTITLSMAIISYAMTFQRSGTYDPIENVDLPYEGAAYPLVEEDSHPPLALGRFQPIPVLAVTTDLGGLVPNLRLAAGLYAPNSYPFRNLCVHQPTGGCQKENFNGDPNELPSPARYDIVQQEAVLFMPTIAASYRVLPNLDIGARFGWGFANVDSTIHVWGQAVNVTEDVGGDGLFHVTGKDNFVPGYGFGVAYRPTDSIELGANYSSELTLDTKGDAESELGPRAGAGGIMVTVVPVPDEFARCATGGTAETQRGCVKIEVPRTVTVGGRYKFLDDKGGEKGDVELDLGWENWGAERASDFLVVIDSEIQTAGGGGFTLKDNVVRHGFQNVYNARLGGSWKVPLGANTLTIRGGLAYDTAAAKKNWLRADIDGAARTTIAAGAGYRASRFEINVGAGVVLEGTNTNTQECNPVSSLPANLGCNGDGVQRPLEDREGPDPINPLNTPQSQVEAPTNAGQFTSHYVMFMLGASTWF